MENSQNFTKRATKVANHLALQFPDMDLRFNFTPGTTELRYFVASVSKEVYSVDLGELTNDKAIQEAIFLIKEITRSYDA